jgi:hypothetical protein
MDHALQARMHELEAQHTEYAGKKEHKRKRRHVIRHTCKVKIQMLIGHAAGYSNDWDFDAVAIPGRILDLNIDGAQLFTKQRLETGQNLRLAIELRVGQQIHTPANIRWVRDLPEKGGFCSGVAFKGLVDADRKAVTAFLQELEASAGF